jgi:hypothetical protein
MYRVDRISLQWLWNGGRAFWRMIRRDIVCEMRSVIASLVGRATALSLPDITTFDVGTMVDKP